MSGNESEKAISDLWTSALPPVASLLGRMSYLGSLRDGTSGVYRQTELARALGETEADRLLRTVHRMTFTGWLCLTLRQQRADFDLLLPASGLERRRFLAWWVREAPYRDFLPAGVADGERLLYLCDLEAITSVLFRECEIEARQERMDMEKAA